MRNRGQGKARGSDAYIYSFSFGRFSKETSPQSLLGVKMLSYFALPKGLKPVYGNPRLVDLCDYFIERSEEKDVSAVAEL